MGAQGTATLNFGAFPGKTDTSVAVTGQTGILTSSLVEAWIRPADTAEHTADEHMLEAIKVSARDIVAGTGFTIYGIASSEIQDVAGNKTMEKQRSLGHRLYGQYTVAWVWN